MYTEGVSLLEPTRVVQIKQLSINWKSLSCLVDLISFL